MKIGERVILNTLLRVGDFPGEIVGISFFELAETCIVKLDCQEKLVRGVLYYESEPDVISSNSWQICYPDKEFIK